MSWGQIWLWALAITVCGALGRWLGALLARFAVWIVSRPVHRDPPRPIPPAPPRDEHLAVVIGPDGTAALFEAGGRGVASLFNATASAGHILARIAQRLVDLKRDNTALREAMARDSGAAERERAKPRPHKFTVSMREPDDEDCNVRLFQVDFTQEVDDALEVQRRRISDWMKRHAGEAAWLEAAEFVRTYHWKDVP